MRQCGNEDGGRKQGQVSNSSYICQVYTDCIGLKLLAFGIWYFCGGDE